MTKKIVQVDMDGVLADWQDAYFNATDTYDYIPYPQAMPGFFSTLNQ